MSDHYIIIDDEPDVEECPDCGCESLYVFKLTAMNDEGIGDMESTISKCFTCPEGADVED